MIPYLINSKEVSGKACEIWLKSRLHKDVATLQTWIGHNVTHYHNWNALAHAVPQTLPYIFSEICLVLGYLQSVTTCYRYKNIQKLLIYIVYKFDGNAW